MGRDKTVADGTVFGFLPAAESDFTADDGHPAALWKISFDLADVCDEDLEEHE
ncbi:hypothetical protein T484DRAFT_1807171, partial [Baffinella frigidus]